MTNLMRQYTPPMSRGGSYGAAIQAYMPNYPAPTVPIPEMLVTGSNVTQQLGVAHEAPTSGSMVVNRRERQLGMRYLYAVGAKAIRQFVMMATGRVQSSQFQPLTSGMWNGAFDDALYQVGYPGRNDGLSFKVATIPRDALGVAPWQMQPRPQWRRSIITNRSFGGAGSLPAKPINSGMQ
jgi:hypothetical protein